MVKKGGIEDEVPDIGPSLNRNYASYHDPPLDVPKSRRTRQGADPFRGPCSTT